MKRPAPWMLRLSTGRVLLIQVILSSNRLQVNDAIDKILRARRTTCLIVAHRLSTIARAERIVVLEGNVFLLVHLRS